jgi:hypothetical protein
VVVTRRRGTALYDEPEDLSGSEEDRSVDWSVTPKKADVRASAGAKAGSSAAKKKQAHENDRARLHYHNGFNDYNGGGSTSSAREGGHGGGALM